MWWHPTRSLCVTHRSTVLTKSRVRDAYIVAHRLCERREGEPHPQLDSVRSVMEPFLKAQKNKVQLQFTLRQLSELAHQQVQASDSTVAVCDAIAPLLDVAAALEASARTYLDTLLACVPSARSITDGLEDNSVLRLWMYDQGADCRPHCDPGLVTALLQGSAPGLEVTFDPVNPARLNSNDYRTLLQNIDGGTSAVLHSDISWVPTQTLISSELPSLTTDQQSHLLLEPVLVMAGTQMEVVTGRTIRGVPHRVASRPHGDYNSCGLLPHHRVNIILELRPRNPKRWFTFHPQNSEVDALHAFAAC